MSSNSNDDAQASRLFPVTGLTFNPWSRFDSDMIRYVIQLRHMTIQQLNRHMNNLGQRMNQIMRAAMSAPYGREQHDALLASNAEYRTLNRMYDMALEVQLEKLSA